MRFVLSFALIAFAVPAVAQDAAPAAKPTEEKQICRRVDVTGSNFGKRECHTKAEWKQISDQNQERAARALENRNPRTGRDN